MTISLQGAMVPGPQSLQSRRKPVVTWDVVSRAQKSYLHYPTIAGEGNYYTNTVAVKASREAYKRVLLPSNFLTALKPSPCLQTY